LRQLATVSIVDLDQLMLQREQLEQHLDFAGKRAVAESKELHASKGYLERLARANESFPCYMRKTHAGTKSPQPRRAVAIAECAARLRSRGPSQQLHARRGRARRHTDRDQPSGARAGERTGYQLVSPLTPAPGADGGGAGLGERAVGGVRAPARRQPTPARP